MKQTLTIIGAGPGGYSAAFYAADCGMDVTLIDENPTLGGVCLHAGCIPSKALLHCGKIIKEATSAQKMGISFDAPQINLEQMRTWKNDIVTRLSNGLKHLALRRNITFIYGKARFINNNALEITTANGDTQEHNFEHAIIATGSHSINLADLPASDCILNSTSALALKDIPQSLLVVGGGYIGLELGTLYANLGCEVSVVEMMPALLKDLDDDCLKILTRQLKKTFKKIYLETALSDITVNDDDVNVNLTPKNKKTRNQSFDKILIAIGRAPNTKTLGLDNTSVICDAKDFIIVDEKQQTPASHIFAIGDVTGNPTLAHKASAQARIAIDALLGKTVCKASNIPAVVFTDPEVAVCGLTEKQALVENRDIKISIFPWSASGRALTLNQTQGMTKLIVDSKTNILIGASIIGPQAGDLISECALAIQQKTTAKDLSHTTHPHPTLSETIMEAAENIFGTATHI